eukprot:Protomagalhaensia_wolfi_Nauph_80__5580@NODE_622_length_2193_cov_116_896007_g467_i0_p1_GENE_NODE_622_length_2193_cov_116_896007_g467_i0NODE_622_length_2193_cov_116_896007_g467_i0_p1_ORF_typecomplete_len326_score65_81Ank_2/PF12796_7/0_00074Ank_2/PF12796_7/4_5e13Ank_4/PF13637_6/3_3e05Ank_4/PF13637_6/1_3e11Ank_5/PF13857_6/0_00024Ank_5/PF13857_6/6_9e10Ank_5/PF13857_6/38Ank_3/PF13606_6/5_9e05Ank_3/PF13606_6/4_4e05Ank_3/PF13606_6/2_9e02Ank/PF00023_30/0_00065Ank/PF00023_30/0_0028Ank/PF00023_30/7_4CortBP
MKLQLESGTFFVLFWMSITTQSTDLERLHAKCRDPSQPITDILNIIEAQYPRLLANLQKQANKKKRKAQNAFEQDELIEAPWLRKALKTETATAGSQSPQQSQSAIGPAIPVQRETEPRPFDLFVLDGDESGTAALRTKLRNWVSQKDGLGRTALHLAAFSGNLDAIKLLTIKDGKGLPLMDIHIAAQDGAQPLHFAASAGHLDAVKLCLRLGSRVNAATSKAKTALDFAQKKGHQDVIDFLLSKHARSTRAAAAENQEASEPPQEKSPEHPEPEERHPEDDEPAPTEGPEEVVANEAAPLSEHIESKEGVGEEPPIAKEPVVED